MLFTRKKLMIAAIVAVLFTSVLYLSCKKEVPENPCKGVQCLNAGACVAGKCSCPSGYTGTYCETVIDPCSSITCQNGGFCSQGYCECPDGTTGSLCETVYRNTYANIYTGGGVDDDGVVYNSFYFKLSLNGTNLKLMSMRILGDGGVLIVPSITVRFEKFSSAGSSFTLLNEVNGDYTYSGSGIVSATNISVSLREVHMLGNVRIYTFNNCPKY